MGRRIYFWDYVCFLRNVCKKLCHFHLLNIIYFILDLILALIIMFMFVCCENFENKCVLFFYFEFVFIFTAFCVYVYVCVFVFFSWNCHKKKYASFSIIWVCNHILSHAIACVHLCFMFFFIFCVCEYVLWSQDLWGAADIGLKCRIQHKSPISLVIHKKIKYFILCFIQNHIFTYGRLC